MSKTQLLKDLTFPSTQTQTLQKSLSQGDKTVFSDGSSTEYYDLPPNSNALNDLIEYKSEIHWLGDSFHLANILKACWRWGVKANTSKDYDARKIIYSACRLLMKHKGKEELRNTLLRILEDKQFS